MSKMRLIGGAVAAAVVLIGCNQVGRKDEVLAKVGNLQLLQSELEFAMSTMPEARRNSLSARQMMFNNLLDSRVRATVAQKEFPQAQAQIKENLLKIRNRDLTQIYQHFFLSENLGHSDDELLAWFRKNKKKLVLDSNQKMDFQLLKDTVVHKMTLAENQDSLQAFFVAQKSQFRQPGDTIDPDFNQVKPQVEQAFIQYWKQKLVQESKAKLHAKHQVEFAQLPEPDYKPYYEKHKEQFKTGATYQLSHIEMADSARLAALVKGATSLDDFQKLAAQHSENAETKAVQGALGVVKKDHCLPHGVGMMPELFAALDGRAAGFVTGVIKAPDTEKYHVFWLQNAIAPQVKSAERAKKDVIARMKAEGLDGIEPNTLLATVAGTKKIYEKDYLALLEEVPPQQKRMYTRAKLLELLIDWEVFATEAQAQKLDQSMYFKALSNLRSSDMWALVFRDSIERKAMGIPSADLQKLYQANPNQVFGSKEFALVENEVALMASIPDFFYQREFAINSEKYQEFSSWEDARGLIFSNIRAEETAKASKRLLHKYRLQLGVEVLDTAFAEINHTMDAQKLYDEARKLYEARKLGDAKALIYDLRSFYADHQELMWQSTMLLAQIYNEEEQFENAVREFTTYVALWPKNADSYKALFMKGFILAENLKQDSAALVAFKTLLEKYPKTDLSEDADWMVRNIESGGQLVPALLDSIAAQDSLEASKISAPQNP